MVKSHSCHGSDYAGYIWEALELEEAMRNIERRKTDKDTEWCNIYTNSSFLLLSGSDFTDPNAEPYMLNQNREPQMGNICLQPAIEFFMIDE